MKHVVSIGGGIASTLVLPLYAASMYGRENVDLVMARLPNEDPDVWRLCEAVEDLTRIKINYIGLNLTPWDVFFQKRMMGNSRIDPCSFGLKREVMRKHMIANYAPDETMLYVGIGAYEIDRQLSIISRWKKIGFDVELPLIDYPMVTRSWSMEFCEQVTGFVPRLYKMGFPHNNCGGACVKAGVSEWARLLYWLPDVFDWWEYNEHEFRKLYGKDVAILREIRNKETKPLTLRVLRHRMERKWGIAKEHDPVDWTGTMFEGLESMPACVFCEGA